MLFIIKVAIGAVAPITVANDTLMVDNDKTSVMIDATSRADANINRLGSFNVRGSQ